MISSSVARVEDSSTVMTPSSPTFSMASPMRSPISWSREATAPTEAMPRLPSTGVACSRSTSVIFSDAAAMPAPSAVGLAPAARLRSPSETRAWASTVAVVVPSPATSLVLVAAVFASWTPRFSKGSSRSISRAMVTPSLVIVGPPKLLLSTTWRPRGPRVTTTAAASWSTPRSRARRAVSSNVICLGTAHPFRCDLGLRTPPPRDPGVGATGAVGCVGSGVVS